MAEQKINSALSDDAKHIAGAVFFMMRPGSSGLSRYAFNYRDRLPRP